jgi:hypothetical protein
MAGDLDAALDELWSQTKKPIPLPTGIAEAAGILNQLYITPP